jgi:hypothetical protein
MKRSIFNNIDYLTILLIVYNNSSLDQPRKINYNSHFFVSDISFFRINKFPKSIFYNKSDSISIKKTKNIKINRKFRTRKREYLKNLEKTAADLETQLK